jgi:hypothetical protein
MSSDYLPSVIDRFLQYKSLAEKTMDQLNDRNLFWQYNKNSNSIAILVQHLSGNMISRFTDFLTEDGEKASRNRDAEFEPENKTREQLLIAWNKGWDCLLQTLYSLTPEDLSKTVSIRNQPMPAIDAINRQLAHYSYHVGQIVFIGKMVLDDRWKTLSIPRRNK